MKAAAAAALFVLALAASGCGSGVGRAISGGAADTSNGKQLFQQKCGFCHTLKEAGTTGTIGPNLDDAFRPDEKQGFKESTIAQVVADQIRFAGDYGIKGPTMPKNLVTGQDVDDVAAYVAAVAGRTGVSIQAPPPSAGTTTTGTTSTAPPSGGGNLAAGKSAFASNGCGACHTLTAAGATGTVGPDLDKLKTYASAAGKPLEAFIHESIVDPNAYIEKGYPKGVMPENFGSLPKSTLDALVAFLAASAKS